MIQIARDNTMIGRDYLEDAIKHEWIFRAALAHVKLAAPTPKELDPYGDFHELLDRYALNDRWNDFSILDFRVGPNWNIPEGDVKLLLRNTPYLAGEVSLWEYSLKDGLSLELRDSIKIIHSEDYVIPPAPFMRPLLERNWTDTKIGLSA